MSSPRFKTLEAELLKGNEPYDKAYRRGTAIKIIGWLAPITAIGGLLGSVARGPFGPLGDALTMGAVFCFVAALFIVPLIVNYREGELECEFRWRPATTSDLELFKLLYPEFDPDHKELKQTLKQDRVIRKSGLLYYAYLLDKEYVEKAVETQEQNIRKEQLQVLLQDEPDAS